MDGHPTYKSIRWPLLTGQQNGNREDHHLENLCLLGKVQGPLERFVFNRSHLVQRPFLDVVLKNER